MTGIWKTLVLVVVCVLLSSAGTSKPEQGELRTRRYVYTGGVAGGKQHGFGVCRYTNGDVYAGHWDMGYKDGLGRFDHADGRVDFGYWKRGVFKPVPGSRFKVGRKCYGIDVAKYQKKVDWTKLSFKADADGNVVVSGKSGRYMQPVLFALVKSTEGITIKDPCFRRNFEGAKRAGIIRGAYHFLSVNSSVEEQVRFFIENTPLEKGDLPPVLDLEISKRTMQRHHRKVCRMALEWLKAIERHYGVKPIVYTYENYYKEYLRGNGFDGYDFWIARYGAEPSARHWEIWQLTDKGVCAGIKHKVDIDLFRGSYADLKKYVKEKGIR